MIAAMHLKCAAAFLLGNIAVDISREALVCLNGVEFCRAIFLAFQTPFDKIKGEEHMFCGGFLCLLKTEESDWRQ